MKDPVVVMTSAHRSVSCRMAGHPVAESSVFPVQRKLRGAGREDSGKEQVGRGGEKKSALSFPLILTRGQHLTVLLIERGSVKDRASTAYRSLHT